MANGKIEFDTAFESFIWKCNFNYQHFSASVSFGSIFHFLEIEIKKKNGHFISLCERWQLNRTWLCHWLNSERLWRPLIQQNEHFFRYLSFYRLSLACLFIRHIFIHFIISHFRIFMSKKKKKTNEENNKNNSIDCYNTWKAPPPAHINYIKCLKVYCYGLSPQLPYQGVCIDMNAPEMLHIVIQISTKQKTKKTPKFGGKTSLNHFSFAFFGFTFWFIYFFFSPSFVNFCTSGNKHSNTHQISINIHVSTNNEI